MRLKSIARPSILLALFWASFFCRAEGPKGFLSPREVFVGDEAVFTYIEENLPLRQLPYFLESAASSFGAIDVPRELIPADTSDIAVKGVRLIPLQERENAALCEITFVPWKTGEVAIPEIALTPNGVRRSQPVKVPVSSLAARYGAVALMPNRPPLLPPGTLYLLYALALCVAAACLAAALAARKLLKLGKGARRIPIKKIRREFARRLKAQGRRIGEGGACWYAEIFALARLFFCKMTDEKKYLAADARDIARLLEEAQGLRDSRAQAAAKRLAAMLAEIERIRFSGEGISEGDSMEREREKSYMEALEEFVALACASPEAFFAPAEAGGASCAKGALSAPL